MKYFLNDKIYNILKWVGLIACPAIAVFVGTVGSAWGWAHIEPIVITINAVGVLIGALIGISQASAKVVPMDERAPEVDTIPEVEGGIYPLTYEEAISVFEGDSDGDQ